MRLRDEFLKSWKSVAESFLFYIRAYGGLAALICSPYLQIALLLALFYNNENVPLTIQQIIPNIVGFSIGAFAIIFAFGTPNFIKLLAAKPDDDDHSSLERIAATFVHIITIQSVTLLLSVLDNSVRSLLKELVKANCKIACIDNLQTANYIISTYQFLETGLFLYSILLIVAASLAIHRVIRIAVHVE